MGDLIFVSVVVAFFAVTLAYVRGCEHIIGRDDVAADDAAAALEASGRGRR